MTYMIPRLWLVPACKHVVGIGPAVYRFSASCKWKTLGVVSCCLPYRLLSSEGWGWQCETSGGWRFSNAIKERTKVHRTGDARLPISSP